MGINQDGEEMNGSKRNLTIIEETIETEEETVDPHNTEPLNVDPPQQPPSNPKQEVPVIAMTDFSAVNMEEKLNLLMVAINKINTNFHHKFEELHKELNDPISGMGQKIKKCVERITDLEEALEDEQDGINPRLKDAELNIQDMQITMDSLGEELQNLQEQVVLLNGTAQTQDTQLWSITHKLVDITKRSMSNNVIISGILGEAKDEDCQAKVVKFLKETMEMEIDDDKQVEVAHRLGEWIIGWVRPIVVRCHPHLRKQIFQHTKKLKDKKNEEGQAYYVDPQLPEPLATQRRENRKRVAEIRVTNDQVDQSKQVEAVIKRGTLYINGREMKKHIKPPTVRDLLAIDAETQRKLDQIKNAESTTIKDKSSEFIGYTAHVNSAPEARLAYLKFKQLSPEADHLIMAYRV